MSRIMIIAAAALTLSACQSATAPTQPTLSPGAATHDELVPNPNCRSGWSVANGRCV